MTGGKGTATRTVRLLGGIFGYAMRLGIRADNPTHGVAKYADQQSGRFLSTVELERLGSALRDAETVGIPWNINSRRARREAPAKKRGGSQDRRRHPRGSCNPPLDPHGCRLREILHLEWRHVDLERGLLLLSNTKTGAKTMVLAAPTTERAGRHSAH